MTEIITTPPKNAIIVQIKKNTRQFDGYYTQKYIFCLKDIKVGPLFAKLLIFAVNIILGCYSRKLCSK